MNKDKASLFDILESMRLAIDYVGNASPDAFERETMTLDAVVRRLGIIGEAVKRLSPSLRAAHPSIPWKEMAGMRDRVNHGYDVVDVALVYRTVTQTIPPMLPMLEAILATLPDGPV